jgi:hypothetical protein
MLKGLMAIALALILSLTTPGRVAGARAQLGDTASTAKIKAEIGRRGTGRNARVRIKLHNGQQLLGRIDQASDNNFTLTDEKTGKSTHVAYSEVRSISARGLSKGKKVGIIAALAVGVVVLVGVLSFKNFHPFENGVLR